MIRERRGIEITGRKELFRTNTEAQQLVREMSESAQAKVINAIPQRDIPEDMQDAVRTSVRIARAYMHHLKIPVRLSEKDILRRCRFVAGDTATLREPNGHTHEITPLPAALYDSITDLFIIHTPRTGVLDRFTLIRFLVHEIMHSISHNEIRFVKHPSGTLRSMRVSGYKNVRIDHTSERSEVVEERFIGLNEAVTDLMALRAIEHSRALPQGYIQLDYANDGYIDEKNLFHIICSTIGNRIGKSEEEMERIFFTGYMNGTRMHLRMISEHFGMEALRILAKMGQHRHTLYHGNTLNSMVLSWFTHELTSERDDLYREIMRYPTPQEIAREEREKEAHYQRLRDKKEPET